MSFFPQHADGVPLHSLDSFDDADGFLGALEKWALLDVEFEVAVEGVVEVGAGSFAEIIYALESVFHGYTVGVEDRPAGGEGGAGVLAPDARGHHCAGETGAFFVGPVYQGQGTVG